MTPEFWHARWRQGEIGWHQTRIDVHLQQYWPRLAVAPGTQVLVPLCGKSLDLLWLAGEGLRVLGIEISRLAVESFFAEHELRPQVTQEPPFLRYRAQELQILCGDFFDLSAAHVQSGGAVYDRASLIALPPDMRPAYARHLQALLPVDARILLITLDYDQTQMAGPPFAVTEDEVRALLGGRFRIQPIAEADALAGNDKFRKRGLTRLLERVYILEPLQARREAR